MKNKKNKKVVKKSVKKSVRWLYVALLLIPWLTIALAVYSCLRAVGD